MRERRASACSYITFAKNYKKVTADKNYTSHIEHKPGIEFYDKNGEMVATYSNNGWTMYTTSAEASRQTEMCVIYNEVWGNAKKGIPLAGHGLVSPAFPFFVIFMEYTMVLIKTHNMRICNIV